MITPSTIFSSSSSPFIDPDQPLPTISNQNSTMAPVEEESPPTSLSLRIPAEEEAPKVLSPELQRLLKVLDELGIMSEHLEFEQLIEEMNAIRDPDSFQVFPHKKAAHFLGGLFISQKTMGAEPLEGLSKKEAVSYFLDLLLGATANQPTLYKDAGFKALLKGLKDQLKVHMAVTAIAEQYPDPVDWAKRAKLFSEWMTYQISSMQPGTSFTIPGGWKDHTMVYEILRAPDSSYTVRLYNTGDGLSHHPYMEGAFRPKYMQVLTTNVVSEETLLCETLWHAYFEVSHENFLETPRHFNARNVYSWLRTLDHDIGEKAIKEAASASFKEAQLAGICSVASLTLLMDHHLSQSTLEGLYPFLYDKIHALALRYYELFLVLKGILPIIVDIDQLPTHLRVREGPPAKKIPEKSSHFSSEQAVFKTLGSLELLEEAANSLRRETIRGLSEKPKLQKEEELHSRTLYLEELQERIAYSKEKCHKALEGFSMLPPLAGVKYSEYIPLPPPSFPEKIDTSSSFKPSQVDLYVFSHANTAWSDPKSVGALHLLFLELCHKNPSRLSKENQYALISWLFTSMPFPDSHFWEEVCRGDRQNSWMIAISNLSTLYIKLMDPLNKFCQADLHFFNMQKILGALLQLSQEDPVLKGCYIDLEALGLTEKNLETGCLFTTDPISDEGVHSIRSFFRHYQQPSNKILLFQHLSSPHFKSVFSLAIPYQFQDPTFVQAGPALNHLWETMPTSVKERIREELTKTYDEQPPTDALILAWAIMKGGADAPSVGYAALQQHLLNMLSLWYDNFNANQQKSSGSLPPTPQQTIPQLSDWRKSGDKHMTFSVNFEKREPKYASIDHRITSYAAPFCSEGERALLKKRRVSEKELMEQQTGSLILCQSAHCTDDQEHQILKTLLHFSQNWHILSKSSEQLRLTSLLLEPGLLLEQLRVNPTLAHHLAQFVKNGYAAFNFSIKDQTTALFFLRLSSQLEAYCIAAGIPKKILDEAEFLPFFKKLDHHWQKSQESESGNSQTLFLVAREALAYCGRRSQIAPEHLASLLRYHLFLGEDPAYFGADIDFRDSRLMEEMGLGKRVLANYICSLKKGPLLSTALAKVLQLGAREEESIAWDLTPPIITSSDKSYQIDLLSGRVYQNGLCRTTQIPEKLAREFVFRLLFSNPNLLKEISVVSVGETQQTTFKDHLSTQYSVISKKDTFYFYRKFPDGDDYLYYPRYKLSSGLEVSFRNSTLWYNPKDRSIHVINASGELTHLHKDLLFQETSSRAVAVNMDASSCPFQKQLLKFDDCMQMWIVNDHVHIDLPIYDIHLDLTPEGIVHGKGSLVGFQLAPCQHLLSLTGLSPYLVFEHSETKEKRVLLPYVYHKPKSDLEVPLESHSILHSKCATFTVQKGEKEPLYSDSLKDRLFLVYCLLKYGKYDRASSLLQTQARKLTPYDELEKELLWEIVTFDSSNDDKDARANLIRLRACALLVENQSLGQKSPNPKEDTSLEKLNKKFDDYFEKEPENSSHNSARTAFDRYLSEFSVIPLNMRLSKKELSLLAVRSYPIRKKVDSLKIPEKRVELPPSDTMEFLYSNPRFNDYNDPLFKKCINQTPNEQILETPYPLGWHINELKKQYTSLYAIARSDKLDFASKQNRLRLKIWISCQYVPPSFALLYRILSVKRDYVHQLPKPEEILEHLQNPQLKQALINKLNQIDPLSTTPKLTGFSKTTPEAALSHKNSFLRTKIKFDYVQPPSLPASSEKEMAKRKLQQDLPLVPKERLSTLFTEKHPPLVDIPSIPPLVTYQAASWYLQPFEQLQTSIEQAAKQEAQHPQQEISSLNLKALEDSLQKDVGIEKEELQAGKKKLLALANKLPTSSVSDSCERMLEVQSGLCPRLRMDDLELLYLKNNRFAFRQANPSLTDEEIDALYQCTAQWLLIATQQQQRKRALKWIDQLKEETDDGLRNDLMQRLHREVSAVRAYDIASHPEMVVLEHKRNLRLRPEQVQHVDELLSKDEDIIKEIIMGSGKSDILLPLLALCHADGKKLVILVMTEELIDIEAPKLQRYAMDFFGQKEIRVNWKDTSLKNLEALLKTLQSTIKTRGFIVATARDLHDFYLEEQALQKDCFESFCELKAGRLKVLLDIRGLLLRLASHAIFDEVDAQFQCNFQVLKALGKPQTVDIPYRHITTALYQILTTNKQITSNIVFDWSRSHSPKALPYVKERDQAMLVDILSSELLESPVLAHCGISFEDTDTIQKVLSFLKAPEGQIATLPDNLTLRTKNILSFARNQLHAILPSTIGKLYEQSYGLIPPKKKEKGAAPSILPVPWRGARSPQRKSQFANYTELMNYSFQTYHKLGTRGVLPVIENLFSKWRTAVHLEIKSSPAQIGITMTTAYQNYADLLGTDLLRTYPHLDTLEQEKIEAIAKAIASDPSKLNLFIAEYILPEVVWYPLHIASTGHTLAKMCKRVYGLSGTIAKDKNTFHNRFQVQTDPTIAGKTALYLSRGPSPIVLDAQQTQEEQLETLLKISKDTAPHAIIDAGALFKDIPPRRLAQTLLDFGKTRSPAITAVIYFEGNKRLILKDGCHKPELYYPSSSDDLYAHITFYDQKHCTGTDISQNPFAIALLTVNKETTYQQKMQAAWRMRGLSLGQKIRLVCLSDLASTINALTKNPHKTITASHLISYAVHVETLKQIEDNRKALLQQIDVEFLATCQSIIGLLSTSLYYSFTPSAENLLVLQALRHLSEFMVKKIKDEPFAQYGQPKEWAASREVFNTFLASLSEQLNTWYATHSQLLLKEAEKPSSDQNFSYNIRTLFKGRASVLTKIEQFSKSMTELIAQTTDPSKNILPSKLPLQISSSVGTSIEVQQETEQNQHKQTQTETTTQTSFIDKEKQDYTLPHFPWQTDQQKIWEDPSYFTPIELPPVKPIEACRSELLGQLEKSPLQNPIFSLRDTLSLTGKLGTETANLDEDFVDLFRSDLLLSVNAACSNKASPPLYGSQKLLEWTLIIQDKERPGHPQLLLLSRKDAEYFKTFLEKDRSSTSFDGRRFKIALFSPRLHAMKSYNQGIYVEGAEKLDKESLFANSHSSTLTDLEQLIVQAKFIMGEATLYSQKELAYLMLWLGKAKNIDRIELLFKQGFLQGSLQKYENTPLEKAFGKLKHSPLSKSPVKPTRLTLKPPPSDKPQPATPPQGTAPLKPMWKETAQEKASLIDRMLRRWSAGDRAKGWMNGFLHNQSSNFVFQLADNPRFQETLDKILDSER